MDNCGHSAHYCLPEIPGAYLMNMQSNALSSKMTSVMIAGFVVTIIVYCIRVAFDVELPSEVVAALTGLIALAAGYITPPGANDVAKVVK